MKAEMKTYQGSCHCGNVKFTVNLALDGLLRCNCSICTKTGALWAFAPMADMTLLTDESAYGDYQFGAMRLTHHFCKTCGIDDSVGEVGGICFIRRWRSKEFIISNQPYSPNPTSPKKEACPNRAGEHGIPR